MVHCNDTQRGAQPLPLNSIRSISSSYQLVDQLQCLVQAVQVARELRFCALWAADNLHQFIGQFFVCCLQPFQVPNMLIAYLIAMPNTSHLEFAYSQD